MPTQVYPAGTVRALLATDHVSAATRAALQERLAPAAEAYEPSFFNPAEFATLRAAAERLIPQAHRASPIDLAAKIDERLAGGQGDGWRYAALPPDGEAYRRGLRGLDETAEARFGAAFSLLAGASQDAVLTAVQGGEAEGAIWRDMPAPRFFEELLAELCECYFSDPIAQEEIGYVGMADLPGWGAIGLNEREVREPKALGDGVG